MEECFSTYLTLCYPNGTTQVQYDQLRLSFFGGFFTAATEMFAALNSQVPEEEIVSYFDEWIEECRKNAEKMTGFKISGREKHPHLAVVIPGGNKNGHPN